MSVRSRTPRPRAVLAVLAVLALVVAVVPPLRARAVGLPAATDAVDVGLPRPLALDVDRRGTELGGIAADRYGRGASVDPAIVVIPGATPEGRDDPRLVRLATALARSGRTVIVPELEVYRPTLVPADLERIAAVVEASAGDGPVTVVGISFGGSLALRALADRPDLHEHVALVVVFGAYADLVGVLQGAATGLVRLGDELVPWRPDPEAGAILRREVLRAVPEEVAGPAQAALDGDRPRSELSPEARAVVELLTHDDPDRTDAIVAALPPDLRDRLQAVSPAPVAGQLRVPVRILHARDDPAVPHAEGRRLAMLLPDARLTTVASFDHVDLELGSPGAVVTAARDLVGVWRLTGALLAAQEPWAPARLR